MNFDMLDKLTQIEKNLSLNITSYRYAQVDGDRIYFIFNKPQPSRFLKSKEVITVYTSIRIHIHIKDLEYFDAKRITIMIVNDFLRETL